MPKKFHLLVLLRLVNNRPINTYINISTIKLLIGNKYLINSVQAASSLLPPLYKMLVAIKEIQKTKHLNFEHFVLVKLMSLLRRRIKKIEVLLSTRFALLIVSVWWNKIKFFVSHFLDHFSRYKLITYLMKGVDVQG